MSALRYIATHASDRRSVLTAIHELIMREDKAVVATVGLMMGKEMIIYKCSGMFKYGLASNKGHMSLHLMPMYASTKIHSSYKTLLPKASFQKGCINFKHETEMPMDIVENMIRDCSAINLLAIRESLGKS